MQRMCLTISYDGTDFVGSQRQPGVRTVQGEIERALDGLGVQRGPVALAGRTDRGVHAHGQVVSLDIAWRASSDDLVAALNADLPRDLGVTSASEAAPDFHARFNATWRDYRYRLIESQTRPVLEQRYAWWRRAPLNAQVADDAARMLEGSHAFGTFASAGRSKQDSAEKLRRKIFSCRWRLVESRHSLTPAIARHEVSVIADGFLPQMVRNIVATLVTVARGLQPPEWIQSVLVANDRGVIGTAAPPEGLTLWRVGYEEFESSVGDVPAVADVSLGV